MIIDFHTHVHPLREQARPIWQGRCPATIENVLRLHDEEALDVSVISSAGHYLRAHTRDEALPLLRESNDYMARLRDAHRDNVVALATAIPGGGDAHLRELERAVKQDDLRGVLISSSHRGAYPDDDDARDFFALAVALDIPVMMHPPAVGFGEKRVLARHHLATHTRWQREHDSLNRGSQTSMPTVYRKAAAQREGYAVARHLHGFGCEAQLVGQCGNQQIYRAIAARVERRDYVFQMQPPGAERVVRRVLRRHEGVVAAGVLETPVQRQIDVVAVGVAGRQRQSHRNDGWRATCPRCKSVDDVGERRIGERGG